MACALLSLAAAGCSTPHTRQAFAECGRRHWRAPFRRLPATGAYVSVIPRADGIEFWNAYLTGEFPEGLNISVWRGPDMEHLGLPTPVFWPKDITDVRDPYKPGGLWPRPVFSRLAVTYDEKDGYVALIGVLAEYKPGSVPMLPALVVSKDAAPESGRYLGMLTGEPAEEAAKRRIWSDCGSILRLPDGRWRVYLNGYGPTLCAAESDALGGPWRFLRTPDGAIRELLACFNTAIAPRKGSCFPTVLKVSDEEWHCWLSDQWEPTEIWHFWSRDGVEWQLYGAQPEITRKAVGGKNIKCLRAYLDPRTRELVGLLSVWEEVPGKADAWSWFLYESRMPIGPPRE
jgi:hypothetical protein